MKKIKMEFSGNLAIIIIVIAVISILAWQIKVNADLKKSFRSIDEELNQQSVAAKHLEELESRIDDLREREAKTNKKVPVNEKEPLPVVKALINLTNETGLRATTFKMRTKAAASDSRFTAAGDLTPMYLQMDATGQFPHILAFLNKINNLDRLVLVEKVSIKRDKNDLPFQKLTIDLVTFTFTQP
ncbi:MAG: type 4a pilus biogenesis protein PilO [Candidatus Omnitrophica bacterium]|nr:type 4a pilus biogenesis protein PilO [Candidatus Omnitrophota bacterium]